MSCCCGGAEPGATSGATKQTQWNFQGGTAPAPLAEGMVAPTIVGTATTRVVSNASPHMASLRSGYVSAVAANAMASLRNTILICQCGIVTPGTGRFRGAGWRWMAQWAISDAVLNPEARMFVGLIGSIAAPTAVDPATLLNKVGFGCDQGNTELQAYANGAAGSQVVTLGPNFPCNVTSIAGSQSWWRAFIYCAPGQTANMVYQWQIERLATGHVASGVWTGAGVNGTPGPTQVLTPQLWRSTGPANTAAVGIDVSMVRLQFEV